MLVYVSVTSLALVHDFRSYVTTVDQWEKRSTVHKNAFDVFVMILPPVCPGAFFFEAIFPNSTNGVNQVSWLNLLGYNARKLPILTWRSTHLRHAHLGRMHLSLPQGAGPCCAWNLEITSFQDVPYWNQGFHSGTPKFPSTSLVIFHNATTLCFFLKASPVTEDFCRKKPNKILDPAPSTFLFSSRLAFSRQHGGLPLSPSLKLFSISGWVLGRCHRFMFLKTSRIMWHRTTAMIIA